MHKDNPNLYWEARTAFLRGYVISYTTSHMKHILSQYKEARSCLWKAHRSLILNYISENSPHGTRPSNILTYGQIS